MPKFYCLFVIQGKETEKSLKIYDQVPIHKQALDKHLLANLYFLYLRVDLINTKI